MKKYLLIISSVLLAASLQAQSVFQLPGKADNSIEGLGHYQIHLQYDLGSYTAPFCVVNLDSDLYPEFLVKEYRNAHPPHRSVKSGWKLSKHPATLYAFDHDGKLLWTFDQGAGIEIGANYGPVLAYDMDGDGISEIYCKTADDPKKERGKGKIVSKDGHEWISRVDPLSGKEISRKPWPARISDDYNQNERQNLIVGYLDGKRPSVIAVRGYMTGITRISAFAMDLTPGWVWCSSDEKDSAKYVGLSHHYCCADVDGDGKDEIALGPMLIDDCGKGMWSAGIGHSDTLYICDFLPENPGLELFAGGDVKKFTGMFDAKSGKVLWSYDFSTQAQNGVGDLDPARPGLEIVLDEDIGKGHGEPPKVVRRIFAPDGKELDKAALGFEDRHFEHHGLPAQVALWQPGEDGVIRKKFPSIVKTLSICQLVGDYFGDGREEVICCRNGVIHIFVNTDEVDAPVSKLTDDRKYRCELGRGTRGFSAYHYLRPLPVYDPVR